MSKTSTRPNKTSAIPSGLAEAFKGLNKESAYLSPDGKDWRFNRARAVALWGKDVKEVKNPNKK